MDEQAFESIVVVVLPGGNIVTYVVEQTESSMAVHAHHDEAIPPAAAPMLLLQLCRAVLPAGRVAFHAWQAEFGLKADFDAVNREMANIPAMSEDELPF